jgi:hypothetical protein
MDFETNSHEKLLPSSGLPEVAKAFYFQPIGDLHVAKPNWLVEGILESGTLSMIYGEPASGKSFLALDLAASVATGRAWNGFNVSQGGAIIFAGEGKSGLTRRARAWSISKSLPLENQPLYLSSGPIDLSEKSSLELIQQEILEIAERGGVEVAVIDTFSRHFGGEENSATDMASFVRTLDTLRQQFEMAIILVHHTGKDSTRGARGSSAMRAAVDTEMVVLKKKNSIISVQNTKQKDSDLFPEMHFQLTKVPLVDELGQESLDLHGRPVSSCVLELCEAPCPEKSLQPAGLNQQKFEAAFTKLSNQGSDPVPIEWLRKESGIDPRRWSEVVNSQAISEKYNFDEDKVELQFPLADS